jgi:hypothetical protein
MPFLITLKFEVIKKGFTPFHFRSKSRVKNLKNLLKNLMTFETLKKMLMEINPSLAELELTAYMIQKYVENELIDLND